MRYCEALEKQWIYEDERNTVRPIRFKYNEYKAQITGFPFEAQTFMVKRPGL